MDLTDIGADQEAPAAPRVGAVALEEAAALAAVALPAVLVASAAALAMVEAASPAAEAAAEDKSCVLAQTYIKNKTRFDLIRTVFFFLLRNIN